MDPPASPPDRPADIDTTLPADIAAGWLIDSDAMALRLGGWHLARDDGDPSPADGPAGSSGSMAAAPLYWTFGAAATCDRLRRLIAAIDAAAERRFAAIVVRTMVRLVVDGCPGTDPIRDVPLSAAVALRVHVSTVGMVVVDLRAGPSKA